MKLRILAALIASAAPLVTLAQSIPNGGKIAQGQIWTVQQWDSAWSSKADTLNGTLNNPILNDPVLNITGLIQCLHVNAVGVVSGTGLDCGSGGGGGNFGALAGGTNTAAAMLVGTGASLAPAGTGVLSANEINGAAPPVNAAAVATNGAGQLLAASSTGSGAVVLANGATLSAEALGTPTSIVLTNGTGLPLATGATGILGTSHGGIGAASFAAAFLPVFSGSITAGDCVQWLTSTSIGDSGSVGCGGGGSGTVSAGTTGQLAGYASSGTVVSGTTVGGGLVLSGTTLSAAYIPRTFSGTSDTILSSDCAGAVKYTSASAVAVTLPQATGSFAGCSVDIVSGGSGTITVTPTTSTVNGNATLPVYPNQSATISASSGNYIASGTALFAVSVPTAIAGGAPSAASTWEYGATSWAGTGAYATTPLRWAAHWDVITDTLACPNTGVGATGLCGGYELYDNLQSGWDGFRFGWENFILINSAPQTISLGGSQVSTNANGIKDRVQANVAMGGLAGSYGGANGSLFGMNPFVTTQTNASNIALISNEVDINSASFAGPGASKYGWLVTLAGNCGSSTCSSESLDNYDNIGFLAGDADDKGTSYWDFIFEAGSEAHSSPSNLETTFIGAKRRFLGSGTNSFNQPSFKYFVDCNACVFASPLVGTYATAISAITVDGTNTAMTVTFGAMTTAPPMGSTLTISGNTNAAFNRGYTVIGNSSTTSALVATMNIPVASLITCASACGTATVTEPQGQAWQTPDASIGPTGTITGYGLQAGPAGITSGTATVGSITVDPQPYGGYVGGAFFGGGNPSVQVSTPNGETGPTVSAINSFVTAALLYTDLTDFVSSAAGAPNGTQVATGCGNGEVITVTSGTHSVSAQITVTTDGSGHVSSAAITTAGAYTVMGGTTPTFTVSGTCTNTAGFIATWLQVGWGISSITLSGNGSGYPPSPAPNVWVTGYTGTINTHPRLVANLTVTTQPVNFPNGITLASGPTLTTIASTLAQSSLPITAPASGFVDANGNVIIGANPPGTVFLSSSTAGSGITITCNTACFTGTAAGDTGRVFTFSDGGTGYKTFLVTGNSGASTTIAQGTLATTLITACAVGTPCAAAGIYETGTNTTTNTAASGTTYPAPLALGYPSGYYSLPATALGAAGIYYCTTSSATDLTVLACFNNKYATGTPAIPGSPTAFSGLTPAAYTQSTSSQALISSSVGAGTMSLNGCLDWNFSYQYDLSATSKTVAGKLGSAGIGIAATTFGSGTMQSRVCNAGAAGVQSLSATYTSPTATTLQTGAPSWSSVATGSAQTAVIQVTLAAATDTLTISNYSITERAN